MNISIVRPLVSVLAAAAPVWAAGPVEESALDRPGRPATEDTRPVAAVSAGVEAGGAIAELIPLGPPTGARDELTVQSSGPASVVPEPATLAVFGVGLLLLFRRRSAG